MPANSSRRSRSPLFPGGNEYPPARTGAITPVHPQFRIRSRSGICPSIERVLWGRAPLLGVRGSSRLPGDEPKETRVPPLSRPAGGFEAAAAHYRISKRYGRRTTEDRVMNQI